MSLSTSSFISLITECLPLPDFSPGYSHPSLAYLAFFSWMVDIVCVTKQSVWIEFSSFKDCFSWRLVYLRLSVRYLQGLSLNFAWPTKSILIPGLLQTLHWPLLLLGLHWMSPIFLLWLHRWKCLPALCVFWVLLRLQFSGHSVELHGDLLSPCADSVAPPHRLQEFFLCTVPSFPEPFPGFSLPEL